VALNFWQGSVDEKENAWLNLASTGALVFTEKYEGKLFNMM